VEDLELLGQLPSAALLAAPRVPAPRAEPPPAPFAPQVRAIKWRSAVLALTRQPTPRLLRAAARPHLPEKLPTEQTACQGSFQTRTVGRRGIFQLAITNLRDIVSHKLGALHNLGLFLLRLKSDCYRQTEFSRH